MHLKVCVVNNWRVVISTAVSIYLPNQAGYTYARFSGEINEQKQGFTMKLIILLIVLGLERYFGVGEKLKRFYCFNPYLKWLHEMLGKQSWFSGFAGAMVTILPIPIIVTLLCALFTHSIQGTKGLMGLILASAILLYSLGPRDLYRQVYAYINGQGKEGGETTHEIESQLLDGASIAEPQAMTKSIFWQANESLFGTLFWFMLFGVFGALFYRCAVLLRQASSQGNSSFANQNIASQQIQNVLDWVPVRIFTLFFALVGHFNASFTHWLENIVTGLNNNRRFISEGGLIALGPVKAEKGSHHAEEYHAALSLIDRSLIVFLAIVALFTLGSWVY